VTDRASASLDLPPEVFEGLVAAWADLLVDDFHARHDSGVVTTNPSTCRIIRTEQHRHTELMPE
jgi:hypothetical protein